MRFASKHGLSVQRIKFTAYIIPMRSKGNKPKRIKVKLAYLLIKTCFIF